MISFAIVLAGLVVLGLAAFLATDRSRLWWKRAIGFLAAFPVGAGLLAFGVLQVWLEGGAQPEARAMTLASGVRYARHVRSTPNPMVWHVARVDLSAPGLSFLVTPGDGTRLLPLTAKTTTDAAKEFHAELAISGDAFSPAMPNSLFEPPPFPGQAVRTLGIASSKGGLYTKAAGAVAGGAAPVETPTLYLSENNTATIGTPVGAPYNAISGTCFALRGGAETAFEGCVDPSGTRPRALLGLDKTRKVLVLIVVDGFRIARSPGATLKEAVSLLVSEGVDVAIELASGGAATMVGRVNGTQALLSEPVTGGIPGLEMPIANHLMILSDAR
jgi:hypothetical protein